MLAADESVGPVVFGRPAPTHHILLVDMNAFFAAIEQRCNPALVGKPVLVCGNATNRTVVTAASYEARPYGIESGMPLFQALPRCPHAVVIEADPLKYIDIARGIQAILLRFSPTVEIYSIDEAFLTIPAHEDPVAAARAIKAAIRAEFLLTCSVGIGPNRLLAKMASGMQKPDGLVWLRAEEVPAHFAALPVKKLPGVGGRLERALHGMGLYTAGQLGRAPTALLVNRFGFVMGNYLHQLGNGIDPTPVHSCFTPPPIRSMGHSYTLAADTHDPDEMRAHLLRLAWAVGRRLRAEGYAGRVVRVMARYSDFTSCVREHRFRDDFDQPLAIFRAALAIIERWDAWNRPIRALGVAVADLRTGARQLSLPLENGRTGEQENGDGITATPPLRLLRLLREPSTQSGSERGLGGEGFTPSTVEGPGERVEPTPSLRFTGRAPLSGLRTRGNRSPLPPSSVPSPRSGEGAPSAREGRVRTPLSSPFPARGEGLGMGSLTAPHSRGAGISCPAKLQRSRVPAIPSSPLSSQERFTPSAVEEGSGGLPCEAPPCGAKQGEAGAPRPGLNPRAESSTSPVGASHHLSPAACPERSRGVQGRAQAPPNNPSPNPLPVYGEGGTRSTRQRALLAALDAICDQYGEKALLPATLVTLKESREGRWSSELGPARNNHKPLGSRRFLLT